MRGACSTSWTKNLRKYDEMKQNGEGNSDVFGGMIPPIGKPGEA